MRKLFLAVIGSALLFAASAPTQAHVQVSVDLTHQRMHVSSSRGSYDWPISSARAGYVTPTGTYGVGHLEKMHYSRKYHMSPMPHSIFFAGGYAIHGTYATGALGSPASHGCVRIAPGNAATLYSLVAAEGATISISGSSGSGTLVARHGHSRGVKVAAKHRGYAQAASVKGYEGVPYASSYRAYYKAPRASHQRASVTSGPGGYYDYGYPPSGYAAAYGFR